jgi:thioredoxin-like negative regulator of GroEL
LDFPHKSLELARLLSYTKRYEASVLQYKKLLDQKPDLAEARLELARVLYWKGDLDEAEKVFSTVPEQQLSPAAKLEMADIHVARKKYEPAVEIYAGHLLSEPSDHAVRLKLAQVLSWTGDYEASAKEFRTILKERPEDIQVRRKYAQVLIWAEKFDQAITELKKTLAEKPLQNLMVMKKPGPCWLLPTSPFYGEIFIQEKK